MGYLPTDAQLENPPSNYQETQLKFKNKLTIAKALETIAIRVLVAEVQRKEDEAYIQVEADEGQKDNGIVDLFLETKNVVSALSYFVSLPCLSGLT